MIEIKSRYQPTEAPTDCVLTIRRGSGQWYQKILSYRSFEEQKEIIRRLRRRGLEVEAQFLCGLGLGESE